jgi:t-SNARE complex subunit (syntaxin)
VVGPRDGEDANETTVDTDASRSFVTLALVLSSVVVVMVIMVVMVVMVVVAVVRVRVMHLDQR